MFQSNILVDGTMLNSVLWSHDPYFDHIGGKHPPKRSFFSPPNAISFLAQKNKQIEDKDTKKKSYGKIRKKKIHLKIV